MSMSQTEVPRSLKGGSLALNRFPQASGVEDRLISLVFHLNGGGLQCLSIVIVVAA